MSMLRLREAWVACCHMRPKLMRPLGLQGGRGIVSPRTDERGKASESSREAGRLWRPLWAKRGYEWQRLGGFGRRHDRPKTKTLQNPRPGGGQDQGPWSP